MSNTTKCSSSFKSKVAGAGGTNEEDIQHADKAISKVLAKNCEGMHESAKCFAQEAFEYNKLIDELKEDIYVDNYLGGADSEGEAIQKYQEASAILASAGLQLSKWTTSSKSVSNHFGKSEVDDHTEMVLGMNWVDLSDLFYFEGLNPNLSFCSTKRSVLSVLSR